MGIVSITKTISGLFSILNQTVSQAFQPTFLQLFSDDKEEELLKEFKNATNVCGMIANTVFVMHFIFGKDFYHLWIPTIDSKKIYLLTILAITPTLFEGYVSPLGYIYTLKMKNKIPCFVTIAGGVANVVGMIVLLTTTSFGEYAVLGTTTVIMTIVYLVFSPIYMSHCLRIQKTYFYPSIIKNLFILIAACVLMMLVKEILPEIRGWLSLILIGGCLAIVLLLFQMFILLGKRNIVMLFRKIVRKERFNRTFVR